MKTFKFLGAAVLASTLVVGPTQAAHSSEPILISLNDIEYRKPDKLIELQQLNDADFQNLLANNWKQVENTLQKYIPAGVDFAPPVPLGFYGPWSSCMTTHFHLACREHITLLIGLMESKARAKMQDAAASPF